MAAGRARGRAVCGCASGETGTTVGTLEWNMCPDGKVVRGQNGWRQQECEKVCVVCGVVGCGEV